MFIYKINSTGWAFVQPNIWLQMEAVTDENGVFLPDITPVCRAFFEMGRIIAGCKEVKSVDVLRLPPTAQETPLCVLVNYVDGTTFLASPYALPWLGEPVEPHKVPIPESLRTKGRDHVVDSRHAMARSMMEGLINQAKDVPVLRDRLEDILTVMDGGTVNRMSDQERALMAGITVETREEPEITDKTRKLHALLSCCLVDDNTPTLEEVQAWDEHTFEVVQAWANAVRYEHNQGHNVDGLQNMPEVLAAVHDRVVYDALHATHKVGGHLTFNKVQAWGHGDRRAAYNWAVNQGQEPDFLTQYVER